MTQPSWPSWFLEGFLGALAPSVAAAIVIAASGESVRAWFKSVATVRVPLRWYAAAIGIPFAIVYATGVVSWALGGPVDWAAFEISLTTIVFSIVIGTLIGGGQEEFGWRGFAQPELQDRYGAFRAAVVIGVFWGLWHLPQFLPGGFRADWPPALIVSYFVGIIGFSVLLAWVFNGSGGSAWLAMVMHGADNATQGRIPIDLGAVAPDGVLLPETLVTINVPHAVLTWLVAMAVVGLVGTALYRDRIRGRVAGVPPSPGSD
ncbi:CPBP family glutamic-type intramembrane protease [Halorubrum sp. HHNYT27]|uniref:CPBP family glutamic-type intramembrane protease n=1 Tax=Halorubrum sp. HHNYT27 TaxID=3402275 RepID=UPI003EC12599